MPLFIVLTMFNAFSGEREQGTLRTVLSLGVRPSTLAAGKALGAAMALGLVALPAAGLAVVALCLTSGFGEWTADLGRALALALAFLVYFFIFAAVSLGVSARAASSRLALTGLLAFWFVSGLIAPRAASDLGAALHPVPTPVEFQRAMQAELDDRVEMERRLDRRRQELMRQYHATSMSDVPINFRGVSLQEGEEHGNEVFDRHYGSLYDTYARQDAAGRLLGVIAPSVPMRLFSMAMAGTDVAHHRAFADAAERYRREIQRLLNGEVAAHTAADFEGGADLWARVPPFDYEMPPLASVVSQHVIDLALLGAWLLASTWFAIRGAARLRAD
ncbi:MAG: DUF3526 domain-containing protein [Vicinamibacterales bacterium]